VGKSTSKFLTAKALCAFVGGSFGYICSSTTKEFPR
jgi:hypothetical protein